MTSARLSFLARASFAFAHTVSKLKGDFEQSITSLSLYPDASSNWLLTLFFPEP